MSLPEVQTRHRRRGILQILLAANGQGNDELLYMALNDSGHNCNREQLGCDLEFLALRELVRLHKQEREMVVTLTDKGDDVANGRQFVEGIDRPRLGRR